MRPIYVIVFALIVGWTVVAVVATLTLGLDGLKGAVLIAPFSPLIVILLLCLTDGDHDF